MNLSFLTIRSANRIRLRPILITVAVLSVILCTALGFVSIKLSQHAVAEEIRKTERAVTRLRSENEVLLAAVTRLSSRQHLTSLVAQSKIAANYITADRVARLTPPASDEGDSATRTALNTVPSRSATR